MNEQQKTLNAKLRGHYQYYTRTNYRAIRRSISESVASGGMLSRRTRGKTADVGKFADILRQYPLLLPRITQARRGQESRLKNPLREICTWGP